MWVHVIREGKCVGLFNFCPFESPIGCRDGLNLNGEYRGRPRQLFKYHRRRATCRTRLIFVLLTHHWSELDEPGRSRTWKSQGPIRHDASPPASASCPSAANFIRTRRTLFTFAPPKRGPAPRASNLPDSLYTLAVIAGQSNNIFVSRMLPYLAEYLILVSFLFGLLWTIPKSLCKIS